ncbi:hypothetical protein J8137_15240, partial [Lactiplantibacillus plantarum]|nr:hypothetical protein [Lactiplantibacillus plantarum]
TIFSGHLLTTSACHDSLVKVLFADRFLYQEYRHADWSAKRTITMLQAFFFTQKRTTWMCGLKKQIFGRRTL